MSLPVNARIQAAQSFARNVRSAQEFLHQQDSTSADARYGALLSRLKEAREHLRWNPAAGRPARFLRASSAQGQALAARAMALAATHGVPHLRELVVKPYIVLYAHSDDRVVLLALKHERQLVFQLMSYQPTRAESPKVGSGPDDPRIDEPWNTPSTTPPRRTRR